MQIEITRRAYLPEVTLGELKLGSLSLFTLERPWIMNPKGPGGMLSQSCIPDGTYEVRPHNSTQHPNTYALVNEQLGVFYQSTPAECGPADARRWGRTTILIHVGNTVEDVIGCVAPGQRCGVVNNGYSVFESGAAMTRLRMLLGSEANHSLTVRATSGTQDRTRPV